MSTDTKRLQSCQAVFFDLDDTLINTQQAYHMALSDIAPQLGLKPSDDTVSKMLQVITKMRSFYIGDAFVALMRENGVTFDQAHQASVGSAERFQQTMLKHEEPLPGAVELLSYLQARGTKLGLATNGYSEWQRTKLKRSGLAHFFPPECVIVSGDLPRFCEKPSPRFYQRCIDSIQVSAPDIAFVGDRPSDILGANIAGMLAVMVETGRMKEYDREYTLEQPAILVADLVELQQLWQP